MEALGFGSFWKPDTFGVVALRIIRSLSSNTEEKPKYQPQSQLTQEKSSGNQLLINDASNVNVHLNAGKRNKAISLVEEDETPSDGAKIFGCPNGHPIEVYPPDDNHPKASIEEDYAKENASGTVITRSYICRWCNSQFKLYWYRQKLGGSTTIYRP